MKNKIDITSKQIKTILPNVLKGIKKKYDSCEVNIVNAWPLIIGEKLFPMTKAVSFENKKLLIYVNNSTLYSLLNNYEKFNLLKKMQEKFSKDAIKDIIFKIG